MIIKNPYFVRPLFDATTTNAMVNWLRNNPGVEFVDIAEARVRFPILQDKTDGHIAHCLQDALSLAADELNASGATPVNVVRQWTWRDFIA